MHTKKNAAQKKLLQQPKPIKQTNRTNRTNRTRRIQKAKTPLFPTTRKHLKLAKPQETTKYSDTRAYNKPINI